MAVGAAVNQTVLCCEPFVLRVQLALLFPDHLVAVILGLIID